MGSNNDILNLVPQIITVPVGVTAAVYVGAAAGQRDVQIRNVSGGGTLSILASNAGSTYAGGTLLALSATFAYFVAASGTESVVNVRGPASFYLAATGATTVVTILRGMGSGY